MKAAFHYAVKVKLIRYESKDNIDFINYEKVFENEMPIIAREEAFKEYHEWINDLYTGIGKPGEYHSDEQARIDLRQFLTPSHIKQVEIDENKIDISNSYEFGIGVYFIIDEPNKNWRHPDMYDKVGQEELIHGIGNSEKYNDPLEISDALNIELMYYENFNYDTGGFEISTMFYDWFLGDKEEIHFLETPFNWTGLDKAPEEIEEQTAESLDIKSIEDIVSNGEGNQVEFKPALLYNFKTGKPGISVKEKIATAICSFLNSNGGLLLIGLGDNGEIQGLDNDFNLTDSKKPKDFFQNEFDQMIDHFLSFDIKSLISGEFYNLQGKSIFIVSVEPSKNRPIFLKGQNGKEFWIRGNAGNRQLKDIEEITNYCIDRW